MKEKVVNIYYVFADFYGILFQPLQPSHYLKNTNTFYTLESYLMWSTLGIKKVSCRSIKSVFISHNFYRDLLIYSNFSKKKKKNYLQKLKKKSYRWKFSQTNFCLSSTQMDPQLFTRMFWSEIYMCQMTKWYVVNWLITVIRALIITPHFCDLKLKDL